MRLGFAFALVCGVVVSQAQSTAAPTAPAQTTKDLGPAHHGPAVVTKVQDGGAKATKDAAVDRTGEARLKDIIKRVSGLKNVHISASTYVSSNDAYLVRDGNTDFYYAGPTSWRLEASTIWSDAFLAVGNSEALQIDSMDDTPVQLLDPIPVIGLGTQSATNDRICLVSLFLAGTDHFDEIVSKTGPVTLKKTGTKDVIEFRNPHAGVQRLVLDGDKIISIDSIPDYASVKTPSAHADIKIEDGVHFEPWMFETKPAASLKVEDKRKKKG